MSPQARPTADELVTRYSAHIKGKVVLTTGISQNSLGAYFVEAIAKASPALIILAGRSAPKSQETADKVRSANPAVQTRFLQVDLGSFKSVRAAAEVLNGWDDVPVVDVVVNNAFVWSNGYQLTVDGVETQLATNHLGHFLLTNLIMDKILASSAPRVVNVSSEGHRVSPVRFGDYNFDVRFPLHILTWLLKYSPLVDLPGRKDLHRPASLCPIKDSQHALLRLSRRETRSWKSQKRPWSPLIQPPPRRNPYQRGTAHGLQDDRRGDA